MRALTKRYGERVVVDGVDLDLHRGDRVALQGPSGAGKTTLGNLLVGLLQPDAGEVIVPMGLPRHAFQKLYQDPAAAFAPKVSLKTSLQDLCTLRRLNWASVVQGLERLGLQADMLARKPAEVSGGELQRLALLRAVLAQPAVLFADEPTSRLDPLTQRDTMAVLLDEQSRQGFALVFVTHDAALARHVAPSRTVPC